eukprot:TRINITY_DN1271_c0_g1_i2.p1 TRINITY_DN1271_c0_g1~~TRINITY_DN1271_c0_g1_i2.p1  ORF type:complete len:424 (+),score=86.04 TRINITY_DN1271_c0_g1_i2:80-1351(+)
MVSCRECGEGIQDSSIGRANKEMEGQMSNDPRADLSLSVFSPVFIDAAPAASEMSTRAYLASRILLLAREAAQRGETSGNVAVAFAVCEECADRLCMELAGLLAAARAERDGAERALQRVRALPTPPSQALSHEIAALESEESALLARLSAAENDRISLKSLETALETDEMALKKAETALWEAQNSLENEQNALMEALEAAKKRAAAAGNLLQRLAGTNVFNDTFHIWHQGHFGTINGFRVGRLPQSALSGSNSAQNDPKTAQNGPKSAQNGPKMPKNAPKSHENAPEWPEINAGLGQMALLMHSLARKCDFSYENVKIWPLGSFSRVEFDGKSGNLFGEGGWKLWNSQLDRALVGLLHAVAQLAGHLARRAPELLPPYEMAPSQAQIGGLSIKLGFGGDEKWTRAVKYLLTNMKFLLFYASK